MNKAYQTFKKADQILKKVAELIMIPLYILAASTAVMTVFMIISTVWVNI